MLLCGTTGGEICIFSIGSQIYRATMPISSNGLLCGLVHDDFIYVGGGDGKIKKLSIGNGQWTLTHEAQLDSKVTSINLSIDKKELIVGTHHGKIYRVLIGDLSFLLHSDAHSNVINDLAFNSNNSDKFVCIDENGAVKMWDLSEYKCLFTAHPSKMCGGTSCTISKDDNQVITGWRDGFIRSFDSQNGQPLWEMAGAHRGAVTTVYADANYILSGGQDGAVRVWQRGTRKLLIQFND